MYLGVLVVRDSSESAGHAHGISRGKLSVLGSILGQVLRIESEVKAITNGPLEASWPVIEI